MLCLRCDVRWLAIIMCRALIDVAVCCDSASTSGGLTIMRVDTRCSVLCLPCDDRRARHNDVPREDRCESVL